MKLVFAITRKLMYGCRHLPYNYPLWGQLTTEIKPAYDHVKSPVEGRLYKVKFHTVIFPPPSFLKGCGFKGFCFFPENKRTLVKANS